MLDRELIGCYKQFIRENSRARDEKTVVAYANSIQDLHDHGHLAGDLLDATEKLLDKDPFDEPHLSNTKITALRYLKRFLQSLSSTPLATSISTPAPRTRRASSDMITPPMGPDEENEQVRYEGNVAAWEQIPGLCAFLREEHGRIRQCLLSLMDRDVPCQLYDVPIRLSKRILPKNYTNSDEYIARKIDEAQRQQERLLSLEELTEIVRAARSFTDLITGRFVREYRFENGEVGPCIVLYYLVPNTADLYEYQAKMAQVLAHEYLHYTEFMCYEHSAFKSKYVSEAMADYFGVLYSLERGDTLLARARYELWRDRFGSNWPYAHALYFYFDRGRKVFTPDGVPEKLPMVFSILPDVKPAHHVLVNG